MKECIDMKRMEVRRAARPESVSKERRLGAWTGAFVGSSGKGSVANNWQGSVMVSLSIF